MALAASVGSWFSDRNAAPKSTALMFTACGVFQLCCPVYATSSAIAQGSAICTPAFHCQDEGILASYW